MVFNRENFLIFQLFPKVLPPEMFLFHGHFSFMADPYTRNIESFPNEFKKCVCSKALKQSVACHSSQALTTVGGSIMAVH